MYNLYVNPNSCYKHKAVQNGYPITYAYDYVRSLFSSSICMEYILIQFQMVNLASGTNFYAILYILWRCSYHCLEWYCDCFCWIRVFKYKEIINWWTMPNVLTVDTNKSSFVTQLLYYDPFRSFLTLSPFILLLFFVILVLLRKEDQPPYELHTMYCVHLLYSS